MRIVRRLYFYTIAAISLEVVLWGLIRLARSFFCGKGIGVCGGAGILAQGLALILVGVPVFGFHWGMVERFARREGEERASAVRAAFLYGVLLGTLIPIVQSTLSLLDKLALQAVSLSPSQAILGPNQSWSDNLIAMVMNALAAVYFIHILRLDWQSIAPKEPFANLRRIYRHIWLIYSLAFVVGAVQQLLHFLLNIFPGGLGFQYRASGAHGLVLALIGVPLWYLAWKTVQDSLAEPSERESLLRLGVLYFLSLAGVVTVLASAGVLVDVILRVILGEAMKTGVFIQRLSTPLSIGFPLAGVWAYYGRWLGRAIAESPDAPRRAGMRRLYSYILSAIGLGAAFTGMVLLLGFVVDAAIGHIIWADVLRSRLAAALATLCVGLPLWWLAWRPMQAEAMITGDEGDHARRSLIRKVYLYLALFAAVVGGMVNAVSLLNLLLRSFFGGAVANLLQLVLKDLEYLFLFIGLGLYHGLMLRKDGRLASEALAEKHAAFPVLVFDPGDGAFGQSMRAALQKMMPRLPVVIQNVNQPVAEENASKTILLPGDLAINPPASLQKWLSTYKGNKVIVPQAVPGWFWAGGLHQLPEAAAQAAQNIRQMAEEQEVHQQSRRPNWMVFVYILAGLFGLELVGALVALGMSLLGK